MFLGVKSLAFLRSTIRKARTIGQVTRRGITTQELDRAKGDRERIVILGSGWAGYNLSRQLDTRKFQPIIVSPRSYFVFTPLLASTAVGTLEFRTTLESVRKRNSGVEFIQGWADDIDLDQKRVFVEESAIQQDDNLALTSLSSAERGDSLTKKGNVYSLAYDKLVIAVGCYSQTFGTRGVKENALFLKDVGDARKIRKRILDCFETAALPSTSEAVKRQLLNFAIIGGGPTGIEFSAELYDLCLEDMKKLYPAIIKYVHITVYDVAPRILSMFDSALANYALETMRRDGIEVKTEHHIKELRRGARGTEAGENGLMTLETKEDGEVGIGMCVWSTGLMMNPFIQKSLADVHTYPKSSAMPSGDAPVDPSNIKWFLKCHPKTGGLMVDDRFRVKIIPQKPNKQESSHTEATIKDVFALGDVAVMEKIMLPATAQVANQEAKWLAKRLNNGDLDKRVFKFKSLGVLTYIGNMRAIMQTGGASEIKGRTAWIIWRGAYLTQTISWRNKILIPIYWALNKIFGRDISRF